MATQSDLLLEIINLTLDSSGSLSDAMRRAMVLSTALKSEPFTAWVRRELNGYSEDDDLPSYREFSSEPVGNFAGSFGSSIRNQPIHSAAFEPEHRDLFTSIELRNGVGFYDKELLAHSPTIILQKPIPQDFVVYYRDRIIRGYTWMEGWQPIPLSAFRNLVEEVRNRLLSFCLEIKSADSSQGLRNGDVQPLPQSQIANIFYTTINTSSSNVSVGGTNVSQSLSTIQVGSTECLAD